MTSPEPLKEGRVKMGAQLTVGSGTWTLTWCSALAVTRSCAFRSSGDFSKPWYAWIWEWGLWAFLFCSKIFNSDPETPGLIGQHWEWLQFIESFSESCLFKFGRILCIFILWAVQGPGTRSLGSHMGSWLFLYSEGSTVVWQWSLWYWELKLVPCTS